MFGYVRVFVTQKADFVNISYILQPKPWFWQSRQCALWGMARQALQELWDLTPPSMLVGGRMDDLVQAYTIQIPAELIETDSVEALGNAVLSQPLRFGISAAKKRFETAKAAV